ncbi:hypothetical protein VPH35_123625 [Triticum aestivum]
MHACLVHTAGWTREFAGAGLRLLLLVDDAEALGLAVELVDVDRREAHVVPALHGQQGRRRRAPTVAAQPPRGRPPDTQGGAAELGVRRGGEARALAPPPPRLPAAAYPRRRRRGAHGHGEAGHG